MLRPKQTAAKSYAPAPIANPNLLPQKIVDLLDPAFGKAKPTEVSIMVADSAEESASPDTPMGPGEPGALGLAGAAIPGRTYSDALSPAAVSITPSPTSPMPAADAAAAEAQTQLAQIVPP